MSKIISLPIVFSILFLVSLIATAEGGGGSHSHSTDKKEMHSMEGMQPDMKEKENDMDNMEHSMTGHGDVGPCSGGAHSDMKMMEPLVKGPDFYEGKVRIVSPKDGDVINRPSVRVQFELIDKGSAGQHLHIYLDGECKKMIMSGKTHILANLSEGEHTIDLKLMTEHHQNTGAKDSVKITVVNQ
jgi:hypothetical protein